MSRMRAPIDFATLRDGVEPAVYVVSGIVGPEFGPASQIAYDLTVNNPHDPDRTGSLMEFPAVLPRHNRLPDTLNTVPAKVGTLGIGLLTEGGRAFEPFVFETPHFVDCPPPGPGGGDSPGTMLLNAVRGMNPAQRAELRALLAGVGV